MFNPHQLLLILSLILTPLVVTTLIFHRDVLQFLRRMSILPPRAAPMLFVRWLQAQHLDALRAAGIQLTPHKIRGVEGYVIARGQVKRALKALNARVISRFKTDSQDVDEAVISFRLPRAEAHTFVSLRDELEYARVRVLRKWLSQRRVEQVVRESFVPVMHKPVVIHLNRGKNARAVEDGKFHIHVWSAPAGSWRQRPPDRLFGVPVQDRHQGFGLSGNGIVIFDSGSEYPVAELVGNDNLFIYFNALTTAHDTELALLVRIAEALREEMQVDRFLADIVSSLPSDGFPIGAANAEGFSIFDQGFDGRRRDVIKSLVKEILIPAIRCDVFVKQCQGTNQEPLEDGMFHVFLSSGPLGTPKLPTPERLFGYRLLKQENAFHPSGRGIPICDPTGFQIGELVGKNLYVYCDLVHYGNSKGAALFAKLLMAVRRELVPLTPRERVERDAAIFADQLWWQIATPVKVDAATAKASEAALSQQLKATRQAEVELFRLEGTPNESIGREFDELWKINKVRNIAVTDDWLSVTTDVLFCRDPRDGLVHEIGAFVIHIPTQPGGTIVWKNQTRTVSGPDGVKMNGPHINAKGHACLGNTKDIFPDLIRKREFSSAVELAIAFVESVNPGDVWGKYIVNWPVAVTKK